MTKYMILAAFSAVMATDAIADELFAFVPTNENSTLETYQAVAVSWTSGDTFVCQIRRESFEYTTGGFKVEVVNDGSVYSRILTCEEEANDG